MAYAKDPGSYPSWMHMLLSPSVELPQTTTYPDKKQAFNIRSRLYGFAAAIRNTYGPEDPRAVRASSFLITTTEQPDGSCIVTITNRHEDDPFGLMQQLNKKIEAAVAETVQQDTRVMGKTDDYMEKMYGPRRNRGNEGDN